MENKTAATMGGRKETSNGSHSTKLSRRQAAIINYLQTHSGGITVFECVQYLGFTAVHPRIHELRQLGYVFATRTEETPDGTRYFRYFLVSTPEQREQAAQRACATQAAHTLEGKA